MKQDAPKYQLLESGTFVIDNYNRAKPFSSFLPGVCGLMGIPLWAFYVNRGQGLSSFGTLDKDHAILEFQPANKAYQQTPRVGFRTFIKAKEFTYEPFQIPKKGDKEIAQQMRINSSSLEIKETHAKHELEIAVTYFTLPNEPFAGLARVLKIKNKSKRKLELSLLDGLPQIVPYGMTNWLLKHMSRTAEAWIQASTLSNGTVGYFNLKAEVIDSPEMTPIEQGHFYTSHLQKGKTCQPTQVIFDPSLVFGPNTDLDTPEVFFDDFKIPQKQILANKTPCAFGHAQLELKPNEEITLSTTLGKIQNKESLKKVLPKLNSPQTFTQKAKENKKIIEQIEDRMWTRSASPAFDNYCRQSFLDNVLRGGLPHIVPTKKEPFIFHVYWRKHGDLERDYNQFQVMPTYFAQGNANYRDVNQNRRMDPWFCPEVGESNILTFLNLIQLDGYNPLVLKSVKFHLTLNNEKELETYFEKKDIKDVLVCLKKPLAPGKFLMWLDEKEIKPRKEKKTLLRFLLSHSERIQEINPSEGFWVDHWHYNLDLLDSYLGLYPEKWRELLIEKEVFSFYDSYLRVRPRKDKLVLFNGHVRQFQAVLEDKEKERALHNSGKHAGKVRTNFGKGEVYHTTLLAKLFVLLFNKIASLDPFGVGIEMEADRPNWCDALNGLPGLLGSSVSETFEIKRLIHLLQENLTEKLKFPVEVVEFFQKIEKAFGSNALDYWEKTTTAKETYREKIRWGIHGNEKTISLKELESFLTQAEKKVNAGLQKAWRPKEKAYTSYFINEVTDHKIIEEKDKKGKLKKNKKGQVCVEPKKFKQKPLPLFLEGNVHALRLEKENKKARALYDAVRKSDLYDKKLGMYKVNASIQNETVELGRNRIFSPGWLENGSVFMHMEFKYLLELLRSGLVKEFYADLKKALPAFMDPAVYGRSIIENSTFIASSNNPDPRVHGTGFVARLSGTNAEWLHIWHLMTVGEKPFQLNQKGELEFCPQPLLPGWLFTEKEKTFSFRFLGEIEFTYHNPTRKDCFGPNPTQIKKWVLTDSRGKKLALPGKTIQGKLAEQIRAREIKSIVSELA